MNNGVKVKTKGLTVSGASTLAGVKDGKECHAVGIVQARIAVVAEGTGEGAHPRDL